MASSSYKMPTWQEIVDDPSNVAVYRWVITKGGGLQIIHSANGMYQGDDPQYGVFISKNSPRMDYTYIAHLNCSWHICPSGWRATFGCAYSDRDTLEVLEILDLNDSMEREVVWKCKDEVGGNSESSLSQEAKKVPDQQIKKLTKRPDWTLDIPSQKQGGFRDDNGNGLLRFTITRYLDGLEGSQQSQQLSWAKKEVPGKQFTGLTDAELIRLKFDGIIPHV